MKRTSVLVLLACAVLALAGTVPGEQPSGTTGLPAPPAAPGAAAKIDSGDTAWLLTSSALVLLMTVPGLALFYGGMVRQKNVLATIMQAFIILALISLQWVLWGYSLAFGPDKGGIVGGLDWLGLRGVGLQPNPDYAATVPHQAYMVFQLMFAVITPALITGTFAERMKFSTFIVFTLVWATLIYDPLAHWVWGTGGWLKRVGALDFAGGTVVHISSGVSALAAALVIGRRRGYGREPMPPHNLPLTVAGAALLWFGWFGFHGVGGTWGALATGFFAWKAINPDGGDGLLHGNPGQVWIQLTAIAASWVFAFVGTFVILKVLDALMGLRVSEQDEAAGLDLSQHSETAYMLGGSSYGEYSVGAFSGAMRVAPSKAPPAHCARRENGLEACPFTVV